MSRDYHETVTIGGVSGVRFEVRTTVTLAGGYVMMDIDDLIVSIPYSKAVRLAEVLTAACANLAQRGCTEEQES